MRRAIQKKAKFDIMDLNTIKVVCNYDVCNKQHFLLVMIMMLVGWFVYLPLLQVAKSSFVPVLFGHALNDDFIRPHHSDRIYEAYVVS